MNVRVEIVRKLELYEPTSEKSMTDSDIVFRANGTSYRYGKQHRPSDDKPYFYHFPIIVDDDGSPWVEGNRYLLSRLDHIIPAKHRTLESIAGDLVHFRKWLISEEIDFLNVPERVRARPTYRYCAHLHDELRLQKVKASTAKRRMSSVQNFYRWLSEDVHSFEHGLWLENDARIAFKDYRGFQQTKSVKSTDLNRSFKTPKNSDDYGVYIDDGGKLRPLPKDEQISLVESLKRVGNIEMILGFLFALTTGARLQTVFTLRQKHFSQWLSDDTSYHRLKVGGGTLINTKNNKQMVLLVPAWLYRRFQVYLNSERYKKRLVCASHVYSDEGEQYALLTRTGQPYYMAYQDGFNALYRSPPRGNAVTQFIRQQLLPDLKANSHNFEFRFHDLRATFGMNLLEGKLVDYQRGGISVANQPDFFQLLMYVRERMGHTQLSTTEAYLNYRQKYHLAAHVQSEYERYLEQSIDHVGE